MTPSSADPFPWPGAVGPASPPPACPASSPSANAEAPPPGGPAAHGKDGLVNLFSPEAVADPTAVHERLRAEYGPVAPVLVADDLPAWLVLGYQENLEAARTSTRFTRDARIWNLAREGKVPATSPLLPMTEWKPMVRFTEGDEHRRLRAAINDSLAGLNRRGIRRHITRFANELIDGFCSTGMADLVTQFAQHLPMLVMARLLGIPDHAGPSLVKATQDLVTGAKTAVASNEHIVATLKQAVTEKRAVPGNDVASWLLGHSAGLTDMEVVQNLRVALVIGNETTISLISSTLRMVLTDPRFRASLAGGHMTLPDAVEQILWDEPPFRTLVGRWAVADTELGGQQIRAGDLILLGLAAGNADPAVRPDLDVPLFGNRSHLSFGGGAHECPGQDISRAITETAIDTLLVRLPDVSLAVSEDELRYNNAWVTRHLATLPVTFTPKRPAAGDRPAPRAIASSWGVAMPAAAEAREIAEERRAATPTPSGRPAGEAASITSRCASLLRRLLRTVR